MDQSPSYTLSPGLVVTSRSAVKFSNEPCSQQVIIQKWSSRPCSVLNGKKVSRAWGDLLTLPANCVCFNLPNRVLSEVKKDWIAESLRVPSPNPVLGTVASLNGFSLCFIVFCKIKPLIVIGVHVTQAVFFFYLDMSFVFFRDVRRLGCSIFKVPRTAFESQWTTTKGEFKRRSNKYIVKWLTDCITHWLNNWLTDWLTNWLTDWLTEWLNDWQTDWLADSLTHWLTDWLAYWLSD